MYSLQDELEVSNRHLEDARRELDQTTSDRADLAAKLSSAGALTRVGPQASHHIHSYVDMRMRLQVCAWVRAGACRWVKVHVGRRTVIAACYG